MSFLSFLFGPGPVKKALQQGAVIIDVRSPHEYDNGRIPGSLNIPVDRIPGSIERIRQLRKPVIICGSDSGRCHKAISILKRNGIKDVYFGGHWESLWRKL